MLRAAIIAFAAALPLAAQTTDVPAPPVAQPVNPLAPPPDAPVAPIAQPVVPPPVPTTNAAPIAGGNIVITTPSAARFESAMTFFNAGQYGDAVTAFSDFIANFPQDRRREEALFRLAESYRALKQTDDALAAYTFQTQAYPDGLLRVNAELRRGAILFDQQKFADAIAPLQFVVDKGDAGLQEAAKYLLGRALLSTQKEPDARAILQPIADQQPPGKFSGDAAQTLAELDDAQQNFADAFPLWQRAFNQATDLTVKATAAARGGWSALQAKKPDDAEKLLQAARKYDATGDARKVANTGLLRLLFQQKRYGEWAALFTAEQGKTLDNARAEILYDRGHANFLLKRWKESVAGYDDYLASYGTSDSAQDAAYERFLADTQIEHTRAPSEAEAYLKTWPKSPYRAKVQLVEAQELSRENKFSDALPLWENLANEKGGDGWPHQDILLERARAYDELKNWPKAASSYQALLDEAATNSTTASGKRAQQLLSAQARLAVSLQNSNQLLAATNAWQTLLTKAPAGSTEEEAALESLGLIYAKGGPSQEALLVQTFRKLLDQFPQSPLRALAAFTVGDSLFHAHDYAGAEPLLRNAREWDAKTWQQPATQRLALAAFGLKDADKTMVYVKEYDAIPAPADPQAANASRLPAAIFYWLGESARKAGRLDTAEFFYARVTTHPDPGDLLAGAWWQLGEVQSQRKEWLKATTSYTKYRTIKPDAKDATVVLLALGRAELGAGDYEDAKKIAEQALLQEPEGPRSAEARMLLGETAFTAGNFPEAAKQFALLATLFDDPKITPQAATRAADAFDRGGDAKSAAEWRAKVKDKYPQFQPGSYL